MSNLPTLDELRAMEKAMMSLKLSTIDELRELERAATPGPWQHYARACSKRCWVPETAHATATETKARIDAQLMCAARNALPHLLAIAEAVKAIREEHHPGCMCSICVTYQAASAAGIFGEVGG